MVFALLWIAGVADTGRPVRAEGEKSICVPSIWTGKNRLTQGVAYVRAIWYGCPGSCGQNIF